MGKKRFIDKKKSATFQLFARDFSDPNFDGTDRVFVRVDNNPYTADRFKPDEKISSNSHFDDDPNSIFADSPEDAENGSFGNSVNFGGGFFGETSSGRLPEDVRREILELGFPDDGYNYLLHLRDIKSTVEGSGFFQNPKAKLDQLPRDVKMIFLSQEQHSPPGVNGFDFIHNLIKRKQHMAAARFSCAFGLHHEFPLEHIFKGHVPKSSIEAKCESIDKAITTLRSFVELYEMVSGVIKFKIRLSTNISNSLMYHFFTAK